MSRRDLLKLFPVLIRLIHFRMSLISKGCVGVRSHNWSSLRFGNDLVIS